MSVEKELTFLPRDKQGRITSLHEPSELQVEALKDTATRLGLGEWTYDTYVFLLKAAEAARAADEDGWRFP